MSAIAAESLVRRFGEHLAVAGITFEVRAGEVFGFLGPNGAGKSTTARMLTGFIAPTSGRALLAGIDVSQHPAAARRRIGVVPEEANAYADLTVLQNVLLMAELHGMSRSASARCAAELLERFELAERSAQKGRELSKGLRQRLMLCMALVSDPEILFLDEPTSGLDVASARLIREIVADLNRRRDMTVFLTTHNMQEAEALCHRVAIINHGTLAAVDTPTALRDQVRSRWSVEVRFDAVGFAPRELVGMAPVDEIVEFPRGFRAFGAHPGRIAQEIALNARTRGLAIEHIRTLEPTLEEIFIALTRDRARRVLPDA